VSIPKSCRDYFFLYSAHKHYKGPVFNLMKSTHTEGQVVVSGSENRNKDGDEDGDEKEDHA
jgi:hypothetical protein